MISGARQTRLRGPELVSTMTSASDKVRSRAVSIGESEPPDFYFWGGHAKASTPVSTCLGVRFSTSVTTRELPDDVSR
jgi:hypothetical protein